MNPPFRCVIVDGPRAAGKTTLINELVARKAPFFSVKFREFSFGLDYDSVNSPMTSPIRQDMLIRYLAQAPIAFPLPIFDRMIGTEIVMSQVKNRATSIATLWELDKMWANIALQVLLLPPLEIRKSRDFKGGEGDASSIDGLWQHYRTYTSIKSIIMDTCDSANVVADLVESILEDITTRQGQ